jgi:Fe-S cluster biogenesis protein NfuA
MRNDEGRFHERMQQIEPLIQVIERSSDSSTQTAARALVQTLLDLHADGLTRILDSLDRSGQPGRAALMAFTNDPAIANLLLLHGLHPTDLETRVRQALATVSAHGCSVELLSAAEGVVRLRINGNGSDASSSSQSLKRRIEDAILMAAPDITRIDVEGEAAEVSPAGRVSLPVLAGSVQQRAFLVEGMGSASK